MKSERIKTGLFLLALGLLCLGGVLALKASTPYGLGLSDDSVAYIAGARAILQGKGYSQIWLASPRQPITHFPPMFSAVLALIGLTGLDPLRGARLVNVLLFGANAALLGLLGWKMSRSRAAGLALALLFTGNAVLLGVHSYALSEPLFLFFSLISFLLFALYFDGERPAWLAGTGVAVGLAYLTRYAGLALLATFMVALVFLHAAWRKRIASLLILLGSAAPWMLAWSLRNVLLAGNTTNRTLQWHPVTFENIHRGIINFSDFLFPILAWRKSIGQFPASLEAILIVIGLALLIWVSVVSLRLLLKPTQSSRPEVVTYTTGLYVFGYLCSILASMSLFDASTKFKDRILSPTYVSLLILLVALGVWVWKLQRKHWQAVMVLLSLFVLGVSFFDCQQTVRELGKAGQGFAGWRWYESKVMAAIRELRGDVMIYTNQPTAVYLWTDRPCLVLPTPVDPVTEQPYLIYEQGLQVVRQDVQQGKAILAIFDWSDVKDPTVVDLEALTEGLYLAGKYGNDFIFAREP